MRSLCRRQRKGGGSEIRGRRETEGRKVDREKEREKERESEGRRRKRGTRSRRERCVCSARTHAYDTTYVRYRSTYDSLQFIVWTSICQVSGRGRYRRFRRIFGVENCQLSQWNSIRIVHQRLCRNNARARARDSKPNVRACMHVL